MNEEDLKNMSPEEILELQKQNCIFCKIIKGEIPSQKIYSDEKILAILDINPANEGHCLILPKDHYQILPQVPKELISHMFIVAKKLSRSVLKSLGVKGTSFFVANGAIAGQKAPHFMVHVIPRIPSDGLFNLPKNNFEDKELDNAYTKLRSKFMPTKVLETPQITTQEDVKSEGSVLQSNQDKEISKKENIKEEISEMPSSSTLEDSLGVKEPDSQKNNEIIVKEEVLEKEDAELENEEETSESKKDEGKKDVNIDDIASLFLK
jgi:histidine triad (HIT) family protein